MMIIIIQINNINNYIIFNLITFKILNIIQYTIYKKMVQYKKQKKHLKKIAEKGGEAFKELMDEQRLFKQYLTP